MLRLNGGTIERVPFVQGGHVAEGASADLAGIYAAYHGKVLAYAAKLLGRDEADDVAQEVFVKVGRSLASLQDPSKLTAWVYAITLNTVRDAARRRCVGPSRVAMNPGLACDDDDGEAPLSRFPDSGSRSPEETSIRNEMVACYLDYVNQLPRNYYDVYVLSEFEDLSNQEIARRLSLSLGTVKIRLHRARTRLYEELRQNCQCYYNARGELMGEPKNA